MDRYQKLIEEKAKRKREFMGKMFYPRTPVLLLDCSDKKILDKKYKDLLEGLSTLGVHTLVVVPASIKNSAESKTVHYVSNDKKSAAYEAADFIVTIDGKVTNIWSKGGVPISPYCGDQTTDYNPLKEEGNGFYFKNPTTWEIFAAIVRALETYQFPYDWENLIRAIIKAK